MKRLTKQYADTKRYYSTHTCDEVVQRLGKLEEAIEILMFNLELHIEEDEELDILTSNEVQMLSKKESKLLKEVFKEVLEDE